MKTLLLFDLDDTIMRNPMVDAVFPCVFGDFRKQRPELTDRILWDEINAILYPRYHAKRVDAFDWDELCGLVAAKYGIEYRFDIAELIAENAHPPFLKIFPHVRENLTRIKEDKNRIMAISTNGHWRYQCPSVTALGILELFDHILTPDRTGFLKGQLGFYKPALDGSKLQITIGDQYDADVDEPRKLGFRAIWIPRELPAEVADITDPFLRAEKINIPAPFTERPDAVITGFDELPAVIAKIEENARLSASR